MFDISSDYPFRGTSQISGLTKDMFTVILQEHWPQENKLKFCSEKSIYSYNPNICISPIYHLPMYSQLLVSTLLSLLNETHVSFMQLNCSVINFRARVNWEPFNFPSIGVLLVLSWLFLHYVDDLWCYFWLPKLDFTDKFSLCFSRRTHFERVPSWPLWHICLAQSIELGKCSVPEHYRLYQG